LIQKQPRQRVLSQDPTVCRPELASLFIAVTAIVKKGEQSLRDPSETLGCHHRPPTTSSTVKK
jgi:hypothetical protein